MKPERFMTWDDMGRLLINSHEIGNHTYSHRNLELYRTRRLSMTSS